jgi:hypothetical protein
MNGAARVVHQPGDGAVPTGDLAEHLVDRCGVGNVQRHGVGIATGGADRLCHLALDVGEDHVGTLLSQPAAVGQTEALRAARHDDDPVQGGHRRSSWSWNLSPRSFRTRLMIESARSTSSASVQRPRGWAITATS